jgi:hypothetical protein
MWFAFTVNAAMSDAFAVYMDDRLIGHIRFSEEIEPRHFHYDAQFHLENTMASRVIVFERVTLRPTRMLEQQLVSTREMLDLLACPQYGFTFDIQVDDVFVNGVFELTARTPFRWRELQTRLEEPWRTTSTRYVDFVDHLAIRQRFVPPDYTDFLTIDEAVEQLTRLERRWITHIVQPGETLGQIVRYYDVTIEHILYANRISLMHVPVPVGTELQIYAYQPFLTVRTIDHMYSTREIPFPTEMVVNYDFQEPHMQRIMQQGYVGVELVTTQITRINGREIRTAIINLEPLRSPIMHIVEVAPLNP